MFYIKFIGRNDKGEGTLINLTNGGDGSKGYITSDDKKIKISNSLKGKTPWNKGLKNCYSNEAKKKMSESRKGKIPHNKGKESPFKGIKLSQETKNKMSESSKDRQRDNNGRFLKNK